MSPLASRCRPLLVAVPAALLVLAGCSSGSDGSDSGGQGSAAAGDLAAEAEGDSPELRRDALKNNSVMDAAEVPADAAFVSGPNEQREDPAMQKAIISKGSVSLTSDDVERTAFDVQKVADKYAGEVTERKTSTDDEGEVRLARLVLRIPSEDFDVAFTDLEQVADLASSSSKSEDVTTQVIDNQVRIRAQRRSLQRVEVLLDRAQSIRDIVAIEAQLTRRQANLDSLEQRQAFLQDQTSMSTITVNVERAEEQEEKAEQKEGSDDSGFLSGLSSGWDALGSFGNGLATVAGAVLPFAVVLALVGGPLLLLLRSRRRSTSTAAPAADA